jgi:hypothetical protein
MNENFSDNRISVGISSQISLAVNGDNIFRDLQERVMKWAFDPERNLRGIPDDAWAGKSFEIDAENSERAAAIALESPKYWAFRMSERLKDTNRIWTTEIGIAEKKAGEAIFGCRLICSQRGAWSKPPRSIPRFVRSIAFTKEAYLDGRRTSPDPWFVDNQNDVDELVDFLLNPRRRSPVVVFALPEDSDDPGQTIIPVQEFIRPTVGYIHTVVISSDASYALTEALGATFSVYRQAIRTYWPGFNPDDDVWSDHPLASAERIAQWESEDDETFLDFLVQQSLRLTRRRDDLEREQPPFSQIKLLSAELARNAARKEGKSDAELLAFADEQINAAKEEAKTSLNMVIAAEEERDGVFEELRQIKANYRALQVRLDTLQEKIRDQGGQDESSPTNYDEVREWGERNLSGAVVLHDRAIKELRACDFQDTDLVYKTLKMMRDFYVPMRRVGGSDLVKKYQQKLAELGLEDTKCFAQKNKARNFGGIYFVRYQGQERELEWHLKGPNSRDGRRGFRLYYFWDADTSYAVVGSLPGHLKNDLT